MLICIDYDGTYTADPELWNKFIKQAKDKGHSVICATMRFKNTEYIEDQYISPDLDAIHYTERQAKSAYLASLQIRPDIWIDDNPSWIYTNSI